MSISTGQLLTKHSFYSPNNNRNSHPPVYPLFAIATTHPNPRPYTNTPLYFHTLPRDPATPTATPASKSSNHQPVTWLLFSPLSRSANNLTIHPRSSLLLYIYVYVSHCGIYMYITFTTLSLSLSLSCEVYICMYTSTASERRRRVLLTGVLPGLHCPGAPTSTCDARALPGGKAAHGARSRTPTIPLDESVYIYIGAWCEEVRACEK